MLLLTRSLLKALSKAAWPNQNSQARKILLGIGLPGSTKHGHNSIWEIMVKLHKLSNRLPIQIENHRMHSVLAVNYGLLMRSFTLLLGKQFCLKYLYIDIK